MRKSALLLLLMLPLAMEVCLAQANAINILCDACRDPHDYPDDYANFAFNQIYGPDAWLTFEQADDFFVTNLDNQKVYVDADYVFTGFNLQGFYVPLWPLFIMQIQLALPNGDLHTVFRSIFQTSLPVPSSTGNAQDNGNTGNVSSSGGGGGDEGEEDEDYDSDAEDYDWEDVEIDEYEGTTWIEDPDEYGDFDDSEWCEEC